MALTTYPAAARDVTSLVRLGGDAKVALDDSPIDGGIG